jgi:hypothetical protein
MKVYVFDNGGKTCDRYTIIREDGDVYAASDNPFNPIGIGMSCGNIGYDYYQKSFGVSWTKGRTERQVNRMVKNETERQVEIARSEPDWMGKEVKDLLTLPALVQLYIKDVVLS